jgi:hypothetical protein
MHKLSQQLQTLFRVGCMLWIIPQRNFTWYKRLDVRKRIAEDGYSLSYNFQLLFQFFQSHITLLLPRSNQCAFFWKNNDFDITGRSQSCTRSIVMIGTVGNRRDMRLKSRVDLWPPPQVFTLRTLQKTVVDVASML